MHGRGPILVAGVPLASFLALIFGLRDVMNFKVGQTLMLNSAPDSPIELKCGGIPLVKGHIGRVGPFVAVKVDRAFRRTAGTSKI